MKSLLSLVLFITLVVCSGLQQRQEPAACVCDHPSCPAGRLDAGSLCACLNNAAMFCWYRNKRACASPSLSVCPGAKQTDPAASPSTSKAPKYTPPYGGGAGGLNCVEIGYCSRPSKSKTAMTITVNGTTSVISVQVGLPTPADIDPFAPTGTVGGMPSEAPIIFTPIPGASGPIDSTPQMTPGPRVKAKALKEKRVNEGRWLG